MSTMCNHFTTVFEVNTKKMEKGKLVHLAGIRGKRSVGLRTLQGTKGTANLFMGLFIIQEGPPRTTPV